MVVRRFRAPSMAGALQQVKDQFGPEAIILASRHHKWLGLFQRVEVVAARDQTLRVPSDLKPQPSRRDKVEPAATTTAMGPAESEKIPVPDRSTLPSGSASVRAVQAYRAVDSPADAHHLQPWLGLLAPLGLDKQLEADLANFLWASGISVAGQNWAVSALAVVLAEWFASQARYVPRPYFTETATTSSAAGTIVLVGPVGGGQIEVVPQLADKIAQRTGRRPVVITANVGAADDGEKLRQPGDLASLSMDVAHSPDQLASLLRQRAAGQWTLIQTGGLDHEDLTNQNLWQPWQKVLDGAEIHLTLPVSWQPQKFRAAVHVFRQFQPTHLLLTKLDSASPRGLLVEAPAQLAVPLSFLSVQQDGAAGLEQATADSCAIWLAAGLTAVGKELADHG